MVRDKSDLDSFGSLLKVFRKRRSLTQQQLATAIGVHRNAISRWEQGEVLPASKGMVVELARHLHLDDQETRQLLEASLTGLSTHWLVPFPRNPFFTGREEILEMLHTQLGVDQPFVPTQLTALHGLGGVGKTQIALEYVYRHALEYSAIFWIGAEKEESMVSSLLCIADVLQLPGRDEKDQQRMVAAVQRWLSTHGQWLLIWDNLEELNLLRDFLPSSRHGAILITTRCQTLGTLAQGIELFPMEEEEGILFLLRRAKILGGKAMKEQLQQLATSKPVEYVTAQKLVMDMGGLPLALDQAGAYLEETQCGLAAYLVLFCARRVALLRRRGEGSPDHPSSVAITFLLAITATMQRHRAVRELLHVCAFLQPDAIPEELFRQGGEYLGATLEAACRDGLEWNQLVSAACSYSLLSRQAEKQTLSLHRLVQIMLREQMGEDEQRTWLGRVVVVLNTLFPEATHDRLRQCERLFPHVLAVADAVSDQGEDQELAELLRKAADYLRECAQYERAEPLYQRALRIFERVLGAEHLAMATSLNGLALLYSWQGKYQQAELLFQHALHLREQTLGAEHLEVATSLNGLAHLLYRQGKYQQAEPLYRRALHIRQQILGVEHPEVAASLICLAVIAGELSENGQAELLFQQALRIGERVLGPEHPNVAHQLANLAEFYKQQQKYEQAEPLYKRALYIWEQALGPEHPNIPYPLTGLAALYMECEKYEQAEPLYKRALHIWEQALGSEHPVVATSLNGLAQLYSRQSKHEQAELLYQRALHLREQHLGQHHPETAQTLHDLAMFRQTQGNLDEALSFVKRALHIRSQVLGDVHPKTIATRTLYTQLLQKQVGARVEAVSQKRSGELSNPRGEERSTDKVQLSPSKTTGAFPANVHPVQEFLDVCCELHPLAWCRIRDLWQTYEYWTATEQGHIPLSRRAFAMQIEARGCRADRTSTARIWRGIRIVKNTM